MITYFQKTATLKNPDLACDKGPLKNNDHKNFPSGCLFEGKSVVSFCRLVAALVPDMFCVFYLVKSHENTNNLTTTKAREK